MSRSLKLGGIQIIVGISLIQMYAKCGSLEGARRFNKMPSHDVVTWNVH